VSVARLSEARSPAETLVCSSTHPSLHDSARRNRAYEEIRIPASGYAGRTPSPAPAMPAPMASAHVLMASAHAIVLAAGLPGEICSVGAGARVHVSHTMAAAGCRAHEGGPSAFPFLCGSWICKQLTNFCCALIFEGEQPLTRTRQPTAAR
jgi:hypothetical protein